MTFFLFSILRADMLCAMLSAPSAMPSALGYFNSAYPNVTLNGTQ